MVEYEKFIAPVGHCGLPERDEEFSRYIFVYNKGADVEAIKQSVEEDAENSSAQVKSAQALGSLDMIYFEMNRAAYLQVCVIVFFTYKQSTSFIIKYMIINYFAIFYRLVPTQRSHQ